MISMKIKQVLWGVLLAVLLCSASLCATDMVTYSVDELDVELSLPAEYNYIFTRDMSEDDPILADWGITKEELFENESVYLDALTENQNQEILLSMIHTDWSEMYYDFNDVSDEDMEKLMEFCRTNNAFSADIDYSSYNLFDRNDQAQFLRLIGAFQQDDANGGVVQYLTVINGNAYTITFNFYGEDVTEEEEALTEEVVSSIVFPVVEEETPDTAMYIVWILILVVIIGLLLSVIYKRKYSVKNLNEEIFDGGENQDEKEEPKKDGEA